ncbi:hypothetical protein [Streptomyces sp. NPDC057702]|uniref:hypothetical protein n=1 Tax=unclassified Streptomyces TaxID=2593676 RepID=UPI0036C49521
MGTKRMRARAAELVASRTESNAEPGAGSEPESGWRAGATGSRSRPAAGPGSDRFAETATWCALETALPSPPPATSGAPRVRPRRRLLPYVMSGIGFALASPLLLVAALEGWDGPALGSRKRRVRREAREAARLRRARARERGLYQTFDGDWTAAAGHKLLTWYAAAPDGERLIVPTADELVLLAAPSRVWFTGRARRLRVVDRVPYRTARPEIPHDADHDLPRFHLTFADGSWLTLVADDDRDQVAEFFRACRSLTRRVPSTG